MMKKFVPSLDQVRLAEALMTAMAFESTIRPIVEAYEQAILEKHRFRIDRNWIQHGCEDKVILDRKYTFLMSDADSKIYYAECFAARDAAGLKVEDPRYCPLLVAENLRIEAENALLKAISSIPGLERIGNAVLTLDERKKALHLTLSLLAPFCGDAKEILQRYSTAEG